MSTRWSAWVAVGVVGTAALAVGLAASSAVPPSVSVYETPVGWTNQFGGAGNEADTGDVYVGRSAAGDVYIAGTTDAALPGASPLGDKDAFLARFDKNGALVWTRILGTADVDVVEGLAVTTGGDTYVTGVTVGDLDGDGPAVADPDGDIYLARYDKNGNRKWVRQFGSTDNDSASGVAVAGSSDIYLSGATYGDADGDGPGFPGGQDALLYRFDRNGNEKWVDQFGTSDEDNTAGVVTRGTTEIYVVGTTGGIIGSDPLGDTDGFVARFDKNGQRIWAHHFGSSASDNATAIAIGGSDIYVSAYTDGDADGPGPPGPIGDEDAVVRKYDKNGATLWTRQFGSGANDSVRGLAATKSAVYVTGLTSDDIDGDGPGVPEGGSDAYLVKLSAAGEQLSTRQFGTPASEIGPKVTLTSTGRPVVVGMTFGAFTGHANLGQGDVFLIQFPA